MRRPRLNTLMLGTTPPKEALTNVPNNMQIATTNCNYAFTLSAPAGGFGWSWITLCLGLLLIGVASAPRCTMFASSSDTSTNSVHLPLSAHFNPSQYQCHRGSTNLAPSFCRQNGLHNKSQHTPERRASAPHRLIEAFSSSLAFQYQALVLLALVSYTAACRGGYGHGIERDLT